MDTEKLAMTIVVAAIATVIGLAAFYFFGIDQRIAKAKVATS